MFRARKRQAVLAVGLGDRVWGADSRNQALVNWIVLNVLYETIRHTILFHETTHGVFDNVWIITDFRHGFKVFDTLTARKLFLHAIDGIEQSQLIKEIRGFPFDRFIRHFT